MPTTRASDARDRLNNMMPPWPAGRVKGMVLPLALVERNRVPKRLNCGLPDVRRTPMLKAPAGGGRYGVRPIGGHGSPEAVERGGRTRAGSTHPTRLRT